jgi:hypothetical protein
VELARSRKQPKAKPRGSFANIFKASSAEETDRESDDGAHQALVIAGMVIVEGTMRVVKLMELNDLTSAKALCEGQSATSQANSLGGVGRQQTLRMSLKQLGISLVDRTPLELLYASFTDIEIGFSTSNQMRKLQAKVGWIQLDNQLANAAYPVALFPSVEAPADGGAQSEAAKPTLSATLIRKSGADGLHIPCCVLEIRPLYVRADEDLLAMLWLFVEHSLLYLNRPEEKHPYKPVLLTVQPSESSSRVYLDEMKILPINLIVSFLSGSVAQSGLLQERIGLTKNSLSSLGLHLASVEDASMGFSELLLRHLSSPKAALPQLLLKRYLNELLYGAAAVLGGASLLGNPVGLFNNLSTGLKDFVYEPAQGFLQGTGVGSGLRKGTDSLVRNAVHGVFNSAAKITGSVSKGVSLLSLDSKYQLERRQFERAKPRHVGEGVKMGLQGLGTGFYQGVTGLVTAPYNGLQEDGAQGFMKGMVQGVMGLAIKPTAGVLDTAVKFTEGISSTAVAKVTVQRKRLPRFFLPDGAMPEFSKEMALALYALRQRDIQDCVHGRYDVLRESEGKFVFVLTAQLIVIYSEETSNDFWSVPQKKILDFWSIPQKKVRGLFHASKPKPQGNGSLNGIRIETTVAPPPFFPGSCSMPSGCHYIYCFFDDETLARALDALRAVDIHLISADALEPTIIAPHSLAAPSPSLAAPSAVNYTIQVYTGDRWGGGTSATVTLILYGTDGELSIEAPKNVLNRNTTWRKSVQHKRGLGNLQSVQVSHDNSGWSPSWFLEHIAIREDAPPSELVKRGPRAWLCRCGLWLAMDDVDGVTNKDGITSKFLSVTDLQNPDEFFASSLLQEAQPELSAADLSDI